MESRHPDMNGDETAAHVVEDLDKGTELSAEASGRHLLPRKVRHDLRSSVGQVIGYTELWFDEIEEFGCVTNVQALRQDLGRIYSAGREILELVNEHIDPIGQRARVAGAESDLVSPPQAPTVQQVSDPRPAEPAGEGGASDRRLLIVDDNETNRDLLTRRLSVAGRVTDAAASGADALELLDARPYDLVLLDILMPEMNGMELLTRIKANEKLLHLPVIMISALDEMDSVVRCIELGADDYLTKPFDPVLLEARVSACLEKKRLRDQERRLFAQLEENYRRLKELETLRDDLTNMIVHDLRTPLTSLLVGLQTLSYSTALDETDREIVGLSIAGGQNLLRQVNDLLDIGKMEDGSLQLERTLLDPQSLIEDAVAQVGALAQEKQIRLAVAVDPEIPQLLADSDKISRTLVNLLGNALKFTPAGGEIFLRAQRQPEEEAAMFSIRDTGEGIPAEALERIFDKFGQVSTRKAGRKMSTGLGLTFCKMVVQAHGGRIWVESELGRGSEFFFVLPRGCEPPTPTDR